MTECNFLTTVSWFGFDRSHVEAKPSDFQEIAEEVRTDIELPDSPQPVSRSDYQEEEVGKSDEATETLAYTGAANPWFVDEHTQENGNQYELSGAANPWFVNQHSGTLTIPLFEHFPSQLQSTVSGKLSQQGCWHCYENKLVKTFPTMLHILCTIQVLS